MNAMELAAFGRRSQTKVDGLIRNKEVLHRRKQP
jgi:hypothetical protein